MAARTSRSQAALKPSPINQETESAGTAAVRPPGAPLEENETPLPTGELRARIAEAAYYRALERGFAAGRETEDWLEAEAQIVGRRNDRQGSN